MSLTRELVRGLLHRKLESDEGRVLNSQGRHVVYDDKTGKPLTIIAQGNPTVGYGHLLSRGFPEEVVDLLLDIDIEEAYAGAQRYTWFSGLNDARAAVIVALVFNMGAAAFAGFRQMHAALALGHFATAAQELLDSRYALQVGDGPGGRLDRAERYARILSTGFWE